ncbi:MAG: L,D-transpeptidase family protein [Acidiphilium sp.]|nr:L,D-transpeptidase family protein [Acidiphilium sp.]MDD4936986.1 L,D-transpeptidase family protein [Acidiphilium sp.]
MVRGDGFLTFAGQQYRVALGERGIVACKGEGDCGTPSGVLPLRRVLYRADRQAPPASAVPIEPIAPDDGWCDDPGHADYNRMIRLPHAAHHEKLWHPDQVYDVIGVLGWNDAPVKRGQGSAIFLHVARDDFQPTAGCLALSRTDLIAVLAHGLTAIEVRND